MSSLVKQVITNPAKVQSFLQVDSAKELPVLGQHQGRQQDGDSSRQYLAIRPCHDSKLRGSHDCHICPANLCKVDDKQSVRAYSHQARILDILQHRA